MKGPTLLIPIAGLLATQPVVACRLPMDPEARKNVVVAAAAEDWRRADAVVHGILLAPDPACRPQPGGGCGQRILVDRVAKGQADPIVALRADVIVVGCSEQSAEPGKPAVFFLSRSEEGYVIFRSEKPNTDAPGNMRQLLNDLPPVEEAAE